MKKAKQVSLTQHNLAVLGVIAKLSKKGQKVTYRQISEKIGTTVSGSQWHIYRLIAAKKLARNKAGIFTVLA